LVEDDEMIGESLRAALRRHGFDADWVRDGRAADAVLASERIDAVLLDLGLPHKGGIEVLKTVRAQLEDRLYGWGEELESNAISVYVHQLRRKIGDERLHTMRGVGYYVGEAKG
jgi:DNA-binding response OmpR family regulator